MNTVSSIVSALAVMLLTVGCETEPSSQIAIAISPNHTALQKGESREFTASGWQDYTWSLSDNTIGVLSTSKGEVTVYTAVRAPATTNDAMLQVLRLTVDITAQGGASTGTNQTPGTTGLVSAEALISHLYTP